MVAARLRFVGTIVKRTREIASSSAPSVHSSRRLLAGVSRQPLMIMVSAFCNAAPVRRDPSFKTCNWQFFHHSADLPSTLEIQFTRFLIRSTYAGGHLSSFNPGASAGARIAASSLTRSGEAASTWVCLTHVPDPQPIFQRAKNALSCIVVIRRTERNSYPRLV